MSTRSRQSTAQPIPLRSSYAGTARQSTSGPTPRRQPTVGPSRQSTVGPTPGRQGDKLPEYQKPEFTLNSAAQRALDNLTRSHDISKLDKLLIEAQSALTTAAGELNDRLGEREAKTKIQVDKHNNGESEDTQGLEKLQQQLATMQEKADGITNRMDETMRKLIDGKHSITRIKNSIIAAAQDARNNASTQASTQNVRTQRARRSRRDGEDDDDDEGSGAEEEEYEDFNPTDPAGATQTVNPAIDIFRKTMEDAEIKYKSISLTARYADDNDYRDFRRVVHDARYPNDEVPMRPTSEWFDEEGGVPAPGIATWRRGNEEGNDSDDDIAIERVGISTKCPLTLQEFKDPVTSRKCNHNFERSAIFEMLRNSTARTPPQPGQRSGERCVQCPVASCSAQLTKNDLHVDKVMARKIGRLQKAKQMQDEESDEGEAGPGTQRRAHVINDEDDDEVDIDDLMDDAHVKPSIKPKPETRPTGATRLPPSSQAPRPTQVFDPSESDDDDDDDDDEDDDGDTTME